MECKLLKGNTSSLERNYMIDSQTIKYIILPRRAEDLRVLISIKKKIKKDKYSKQNKGYSRRRKEGDPGLNAPTHIIIGIISCRGYTNVYKTGKI